MELTARRVASHKRSAHVRLSQGAYFSISAAAAELPALHSTFLFHHNGLAPTAQNPYQNGSYKRKENNKVNKERNYKPSSNVRQAATK